MDGATVIQRVDGATIEKMAAAAYSEWEANENRKSGLLDSEYLAFAWLGLPKQVRDVWRAAIRTAVETMAEPTTDDENALRDARSTAHMKYTEVGSPTEPANDDPNPFQFIRKDDGIWFRSSEWTQERLIKL